MLENQGFTFLACVLKVVFISTLKRLAYEDAKTTLIDYII